MAAKPVEHYLERDIITSFTGENRWLSNFWFVKVTLDGEVYRSVEHAYVAAKSLDPAFRQRVRDCELPSEAKSLGRTVELRPDWDTVKVDVMRNLLQQKFQHRLLRKKLLDTGEATFVEGNWWGDRFWGVCSRTGVGENMLGKLLEEIREQARQESTAGASK